MKKEPGIKERKMAENMKHIANEGIRTQYQFEKKLHSSSPEGN